MHYFSDLFDKVLYMFRICPLHHQEYLNTVHMQYVFVILVLLASASRRQQNYNDMSETCRVLYQINVRNSASRWLQL